QLGRHIEETVYRDGLDRKLAQLSAAPVDRAARERAPREEDAAFLEELAFVFPNEENDPGEAMAMRSPAGGEMEMSGGGSEMAGGTGGIIDELVEAMFAEEEEALREQTLARRAEEIAEWNL